MGKWSRPFNGQLFVSLVIMTFLCTVNTGRGHDRRTGELVHTVDSNTVVESEYNILDQRGTATAVSPTTSPPHSPLSLGRLSSSIQPHRVQHRRGSASAADPWGNHLQLNMNPGRTTTCKLTIVRVNPTPSIQLDERPPSPRHRRHVEFGAHSQNTHRHLGSHGTGKSENTRMSFASVAFALPGSPSGPGPWSGSPTHRHSHSQHRRPSAPKPRLSADQVVSLTQQSCNPRSTPTSPRTPGGSLAAATDSFTAIPDDIFLPIVDHAEEVRALFTSPQPGARLLALLAQTFPPNVRSGISREGRIGVSDIPKAMVVCATRVFGQTSRP